MTVTSLNKKKKKKKKTGPESTDFDKSNTPGSPPSVGEYVTCNLKEPGNTSIC